MSTLREAPGSPHDAGRPASVDGLRASADRYVVIDGRKWRATDPAIPDPLRTELVRELMTARRLVKAAKEAGDPEAETAARHRVHDAKLALGERGRPWWEPPTERSLHQRLGAAIRALLMARRADSSICPSDAARIAGGERWRDVMDDARAVAIDLANDEVVEIRRLGVTVTPESPPPGPLRIARGPALDATAP